MTKTVYVTKAQSRAASAIVQRSAASGRYVRPGVLKIAAASTTREVTSHDDAPSPAARPVRSDEA